MGDKAREGAKPRMDGAIDVIRGAKAAKVNQVED